MALSRIKVGGITGNAIKKGLPDNTISGSAQIASNISGSFTSLSSSLSSRITSEESDFTAAGISGSWQGVIGSGSLGMVSGSSISTGSFAHLRAVELGSTIGSLISGSITESSASFSSRVNLLEGSGSITESSASFSTRVRSIFIKQI